MPSRTKRRDSSVREKAYLLIQRKIASGALKNGEALSELALAKELSSSRTPVREAIGQLVAEGLLDQTRNRGTVVTQMKRQDIIDLFELREALESYAAAKAAQQPSPPADLERLRSLAAEVLSLRDALVQSGASSLDAAHMHQFVACDMAFHTLLMRRAANLRILKVVNETRVLIRIFAMRLRGHSAHDLQRIHDEHQGIVSAVEAQVPDRARQLVIDHLAASQRERLTEFDHWDREASIEASVPAFIDPLGRV